MIRLAGISVAYPGSGSKPHQALGPVDLAIPRGGSCVVIGPSGCGKTTLLFALAGLLTPDAGTVAVDGEPVTGPRRATSLILQQHGLFPWKDALDNAALGLALRGVPRRERRERAMALLSELGIADVARSFPARMSGGQRQRAAIARSLATGPDLLLMDEPFSSLDAMTRESLQDLLLALWREHRFTFVLVTHSIEEAAFLGRTVVVLSSRPGRVQAVLDNPGALTEGARLGEGFHRASLSIRKALEEGQG